MLILTRRAGEEVVGLVGGEEVVFTIVATDGRKVKVGITAPKSMRFDRREVADRILAGEPLKKKVPAKLPA
jgi:carbon storage regulator